MSAVLAPANGDDLRQRKALFESTWTLAIVLSAIGAIVSWYFGFSRLEVAPIVWTLTGLTIAQVLMNGQSDRLRSDDEVRRWAFISHLVGIVVMGVAWHLDGGLQQPTLAFLLMLPLFSGAMLFNFWQQQVATALVIAVLASGALLSSDTNSFIEQRYGLSVITAQQLPDWLPRSRVAFSDVSTSPMYNIILTVTLAVLAIALSATARSIQSLAARFISRTRGLQEETHRAQELSAQLMTKSPCSEVLLAAGSGRILHASERFTIGFDVPPTETGPFLLDAVHFAYPSVIKRLIAQGGDEIQAATLRGRSVVLRIRARLIDVGATPMTRMQIESYDEICWRGSLDAIDEPTFAIDSHGCVVYLNKAATGALGDAAEGSQAAALFGGGQKTVRWWDIAPLDSAKRVLDLGGRRYTASIRRERIAESIGDICFVHLRAKERSDAVAVP
jgi:PAS domain-containing protein